MKRAEERFGISRRSFHAIQEAIDATPEIEEAIIFGSRALGTARRGSDIDIAIKGNRVTPETARALSTQLNERLPIPYYVDVLSYDAIDTPAVRNHIDTHGKRFYRRGR